MPYPNQHAARVKNPDLFDKNSFRSKEISPGIRIITGKLKCQESMTVQTYRFDASKFTADEARKWLDKHDIKIILFERSKNNNMEKARFTKYIRREPDGKGGWKYFYKDEVEKHNTINLKMEFNGKKIFNNFLQMGFSERIGENKTNTSALNSAKKFEKIIVNKNKEHCGVFNSSGDLIFSKEGIFDKIEINAEEANKIRFSEILTHNHPEDKSFSVEDVFLALGLGIKELRVKTQESVYSFKISSKRKSNNYLETIGNNQLFMGKIITYNQELKKYFEKKVENKEISKYDSERMHREVLWETISENDELLKIFNIEYKSIKG